MLCFPWRDLGHSHLKSHGRNLGCRGEVVGEERVQQSRTGALAAFLRGSEVCRTRQVQPLYEIKTRQKCWLAGAFSRSAVFPLFNKNAVQAQLPKQLTWLMAGSKARNQRFWHL